MALSRFPRLLKVSRSLSRSAQRRRLTLETLEERTVLSFLPPTTFAVGVDPRAVTVADFNRDGKPDLAVLNEGQSSTTPSSVSVLLGNGSGSFQPAITTNLQNTGPGQGNALSLAVGDFNGDGLPDVAVNTSGSPANPAVEVLLGKGDGSFQPNHQILSVGQTPFSVAAGDFDHNGTSDLVTANSQGTISLLLSNGDGTFRPRVDVTVGGVPRAIAVADFNGDGRLDVAVAKQLSETVSVLLGQGNGTFARPLIFKTSGQNFTPSSMTVGDMNGDGRPDLVINNIGGLDSVVSQLSVLLGNGDGTFGLPILNSPQTGTEGDVALGDFNNDGKLDAAVGGEAALPDGLNIFNGQGDGSFQPFLLQRVSTGGNNPFGVVAADLNGDGRVDLVAANSFMSGASPTAPSTVGVLLSTSAPVAAAATTTTLSSSASTSVFGQLVSLTVTVSSQAGTPIGSVAFHDGDTLLGFEPVDSTGQATVVVSLGAGSHALTATFFGSPGFAESDSAVVTQTVDRAGTSAALASSVNPAITGQAVTFTTTVASRAGTPTGTVTFKEGSVVLGTVAVGTGGKAALTTSFAAAGSHTITAVYNGDTNFAGSSQSLSEQVNMPSTPQATATSLTSSANPARAGRAVTFTASVRGPAGAGTPTGTITFFVNNQVLARVTLDANGQARITASFPRRGQFTILAVYSGDARFSSSSRSLIQQVNA